MEGTTPMASLITNVGDLVTAFLTWLGDILTFVTAQPLLLVFVLMAVLACTLRYLRKWLPGL